MARKPTAEALGAAATVSAERDVGGADFEREKLHVVREGGLPARWPGLFLLPGGRPRGGMLFPNAEHQVYLTSGVAVIAAF